MRGHGHRRHGHHGHHHHGHHHGHGHHRRRGIGCISFIIGLIVSGFTYNRFNK